MGHTLENWQSQIRGLVRDAGVDLTPPQIADVGVVPALNLYSVDKPRRLVVEQPGAGSAYLSLPAGWLAGFSSIAEIEYPARQNPPRVLDSQSYRLTRSVADVNVEQILLDTTPAASEFVRITFTTVWPTPTHVASVDQLDDVAFQAVTALAASFCLQHLAAETARSRMGALPTQFVDGAQRTRDLREIAKEYRGRYDRFLGRTAPAAGEAGPSAVSIAFDYDPAYDSLFHGRRR